MTLPGRIEGDLYSNPRLTVLWFDHGRAGESFNRRLDIALANWGVGGPRPSSSMAILRNSARLWPVMTACLGTSDTARRQPKPSSHCFDQDGVAQRQQLGVVEAVRRVAGCQFRTSRRGCRLDHGLAGPALMKLMTLPRADQADCPTHKRPGPIPRDLVGELLGKLALPKARLTGETWRPSLLTAGTRVG